MSGSHRKQSEKTLNKTLTLTQEVLENLAESITVISKDFEIKWMNRTARELLMKSTSPLKSMYCYQFGQSKKSSLTNIFLCSSSTINNIPTNNYLKSL